MGRRFNAGGRLSGWVLAGCMLIAPALPLAAQSGRSEGKARALKVVVHINFADTARQHGGLKNVENILKTAAAQGLSAEIEVVCHADGITLLEKSKTAHGAAVESLQKKGVRFAACENTMRQRSIRVQDLLPDAATVPSGAFEVVRRQHDGFAYFKP